MLDKETEETKQPETKPTKKYWSPVATIVITIVIYLLSQIVGGILVALYPAFHHWPRQQTATWLNNSTVAQFVLICVIEAAIILLVRQVLLLKDRALKFIGLAWPTLKDLGYALIGFGIYILIYLFVISIFKAIVPSLNLDQKQQIGFESSRHGLGLVMVFVGLVLLPPLAEEILVRGFLYTGLRRKLPVLIAGLITSGIFAVAHLQFGSGAPLLWVAAIDTFILSIVLVYLREETGKLAAPMLVHMLKNGMTFSVLFIFAH